MIKRKTAQRLAEYLRVVYLAWERQPDLSKFGSGICHALFRSNYEESEDFDAYADMDCLLELTVNGWLNDGSYLCDEGGFDCLNNARATMCLLLAEWIETDLLPTLL